MKNIVILLALLFIGACKKEEAPVDNSPGQNVSNLVAPVQTDTNYSAAEESHYVVRNSKTHLNKLLLFIGGSYSIPRSYNLFCDYGATIGLDVVSLSYPTTTATAPLGTSADQYIFDNYRDELCFGNQVSNVASIDALNCISTRATKLLLFLKANYPNENWGQYLTATNTLLWSKVIVAGHSQGSGHACYLGKRNLVDRIVMLSGPNDYSTYYASPANWLTQPGQTPLTKHFSLLHTRDEIVPFANQVANIRGLGLLAANQAPLLCDNLAAPYSNSRTLSLNIPALSFHNSTVGANAILPLVWEYMLTTP